jgi:hypothetical protein
VTRRLRALFIGGSINQTTQLHAVARQMPEVEVWFSPYYGDISISLFRRLRLIEGTIAGEKLVQRCLRYLREHGLAVDEGGRQNSYDFAITSSDVVIPRNLRGVPLIAVQEGILDPDGVMSRIVQRCPRLLPRWLAGTAATGLSGAYDRFCVASEGYRELFVRRGAPADRVVVTGIPNFDDCEAFRALGFPRSGYVLICTSDARETMKLDDRRRFLRWAAEIAGSRPTIVKLHPNERRERATREIAQFLPHALILAEGPTEAMIANADVLVTQYSSTAFVGLALGKEVHSYHSIEELRRLVPVQNRCAARNIASVCRDVVRERLGLEASSLPAA